jgi:hypothetical protein
MNLSATLRLSFATGLLLGSAHAANIIPNPGFELGTGTDADNWAEIGAGASNGDTIRTTSMANSGSASAYLTVDNLNNPTAGGAFFVEQSLPVGSINPALNYDFSFFGKSDTTDFTGVNLFYQLIWLDQDASDGGGVKGEILNSVVGEIGTSYSQISLPNIDVPDGSDSVLVRFQLAAGGVDDIQQGFSVDDVSLQAIPEPGSLGLLTLGGLLLVRRKRLR